MPPPTNSGNQQDQKCQIPKGNFVTLSKNFFETGFKRIYDICTSGQRYLITLIKALLMRLSLFLNKVVEIEP